MCHYGYDLSRDPSQPALSRQAFYLKCHSDDDFKATYAPFLDLEYVESDELQDDAAVSSTPTT